MLAVLVLNFLVFAVLLRGTDPISCRYWSVTGISGALISVFLLAHSVATAAGSFGGGRFADKNAARTLIVATIGAAVCLLALYLVGTIAFLVVLALLAWACSPSAWCPRSSTPRPGPRDRHGLRRSRGRRIPHRGAVPESANGAGAIQPEIADAGEATMAASLLDRYEPQAIIHVADATPHTRPLQQQTWETFSVSWLISDVGPDIRAGWCRSPDGLSCPHFALKMIKDPTAVSGDQALDLMLRE